ncbi:MAG TPA: hypothetical protein VHC94_11540 [Nitrobacter sp.]|nr:hypothetical protein [Nitrobacter sp.]
MSTDFSVKPVGAPVAASVVQTASGAANDAVPTQLPPEQSVTATDTDVRVRNDAPGTGDTLSHQVFVDRDAGSIVYQVVDNRTSLVLRQFPDEAALRRRAYFRALDAAQNARIRPPVTDRRA